MEYTGFLEWLWRQGENACEIIDLTDVKVSRHPARGPPTPAVPTISLAGLFPDGIGDNDLFGHARMLNAAARGEYQALWARLRAENAALRVFDLGKLVSAPITFFDSFLLSHLKADWQKVARVVGNALASQMDDRVF